MHHLARAAFLCALIDFMDHAEVILDLSRPLYYGPEGFRVWLDFHPLGPYQYNPNCIQGYIPGGKPIERAPIRHNKPREVQPSIYDLEEAL